MEFVILKIGGKCSQEISSLFYAFPRDVIQSIHQIIPLKDVRIGFRALFQPFHWLSSCDCWRRSRDRDRDEDGIGDQGAVGQDEDGMEACQYVLT